MLMRTDPFRELDRFAQQAFGTLARPAAMPMDAYRDGDRFVVHFDLPGIAPESIDLTVEKEVLTVSTERRWEPSEGTQVVASERPQGSFSRQLFLGKGLDVDRVEASYRDGVLTLTIPVAEEAKPRKVQISRHDGTAVGDGEAPAIDATSTPAAAAA
jgi:HSP20 family protein